MKRTLSAKDFFYLFVLMFVAVIAADQAVRFSRRYKVMRFPGTNQYAQTIPQPQQQAATVAVQSPVPTQDNSNTAPVTYSIPSNGYGS